MLAAARAKVNNIFSLFTSLTIIPILKLVKNDSGHASVLLPTEVEARKNSQRNALEQNPQLGDQIVIAGVEA
jgi:hypothetical protein